MYKISVPIYNPNAIRNDREKALVELEKFGAKRVYLGIGVYPKDENHKKEILASIEDNCRFFKEKGFEVGAWCWTFWVKNNTKFTNMRSIRGTEMKEFMCPSDKNFVDYACDYFKGIAKCGVDLIQLDDDFRYGFMSDSPACLCDNHLAEIHKITNSEISLDEIREHILSGKPNIYRDAYLKANGDAFRSFSASLRNAIDEINPNIRIGACTCMTSWDIDGTDAEEIALILAGNTKPFLRLIGAPYWAVDKSWGNSLQDVIELERMECSWIKNKNIEIIAEGDVYPRPRTNCPASYLEGFDTAIRAAGCTNGIIKYGIDYTSKADYETGYSRFHQRNLSLYNDIDKYFGDKKSCGVRVYESMKKVANMTVPTKINQTADIEDFFFSKSARTLAFNTIPTVYEGNGVCGIVFDENARTLPLEALKSGLIIDIAAAEILMDRGIDVGIKEINTSSEQGATPDSFDCEYFIKYDNNINTFGSVICDIELNENAEILSYVSSENKKIPISYKYENSDGNRFLVLNINTRAKADTLLKHYARSRQYAEEIPWLGGKKLPAYVYGHPSLYMQCKEDDNSLAVGLWNFHADIAIEPVVELGEEYSSIEFINCDGKLRGDKVYLSDIAAYGFAGFEVKK